MENQSEEMEMSLEEVVADIWQKVYRAEALMTVILRNQATLIAKATDISEDDAFQQINDQIREEFEALEGGDSDEQVE